MTRKKVMPAYPNNTYVQSVLVQKNQGAFAVVIMWQVSTWSWTLWLLFVSPAESWINELSNDYKYGPNGWLEKKLCLIMCTK